MSNKIMSLESFINIVDFNMRIRSTDGNESTAWIETHFQAHLVRSFKVCYDLFTFINFNQWLKQIHSCEEAFISSRDILFIWRNGKWNNFFVIFVESVLMSASTNIKKWDLRIIKCERSLFILWKNELATCIQRLVFFCESKVSS